MSVKWMLPGMLSEGSVSRGTVRTVDLIPACITALKKIRIYAQEQVYPCKEHGFEGDDDCEECSLVLNEDLFTMMNQYTPEGFFFGSHPDDPANFGVWPLDEEDDLE